MIAFGVTPFGALKGTPSLTWKSEAKPPTEQKIILFP